MLLVLQLTCHPQLNLRCPSNRRIQRSSQLERECVCVCVCACVRACVCVSVYSYSATYSHHRHVFVDIMKSSNSGRQDHRRHREKAACRTSLNIRYQHPRVRDGLHLTGQSAAALGYEFVRVVDEGRGAVNYLN